MSNIDTPMFNATKSEQYQHVVIDGKLSLIDNEQQFNPLSIDFAAKEYQWRAQRYQHELLTKAIRIKHQAEITVVDATAGLGRDSLILASAGMQVIMIERQPLIYPLLADGLQRAKQQKLAAANNLQLRHDNAINVINDAKIAADIIYCDPMFPIKTKSALVKQEMHWLQQVVGIDQDIEALITAARNSSAKKVVVKRPIQAQPVANLMPDFSYSGKQTRFDIYRQKQ